MINRRVFSAGIGAMFAFGSNPLLAQNWGRTRRRGVEDCYSFQGGEDCSTGLDTDIGRDPAFADPQFSSQWCWAACISAAFRWHGYEVSQARIVQRLFGDLRNSGATISQIANAINSEWEDDFGRQFVGIGIYSFGIEGSRGLLVRNLSINSPPIVCNSSHAMLAIDVSYIRDFSGDVVSVNRLTVYDPWPLQSRTRVLTGLALNEVRDVITVGVSAGRFEDME